MAKDEFKNLGFEEEKPTQQGTDETTRKGDIPEKNELKW